MGKERPGSSAVYVQGVFGPFGGVLDPDQSCERATATPCSNPPEPSIQLLHAHLARRHTMQVPCRAQVQCDTKELPHRSFAHATFCGSCTGSTTRMSKHPVSPHTDFLELLRLLKIELAQSRSMHNWGANRWSHLPRSAFTMLLHDRGAPSFPPRSRVLLLQSSLTRDQLL